MASEINIFNEDCMIAMAKMPDKAFDLAIVDPPYGKTVVKGGYMNNCPTGVAKVKSYNKAVWSQEAPDSLYFNELIRISKNQIIFGANHFGFMPPSSCWIVWDKNNTGNYADGELAYTSFKTTLRIFKYIWNGMLQEKMNNKEIRQHPCQKPVDLYSWILRNYASPQAKILDTHLGSGSIAIACYDMGHDLTGFEIDESYYQSAVKRLDNHKRQLTMF